jgi:hypothetical protein
VIAFLRGCLFSVAAGALFYLAGLPETPLRFGIMCGLLVFMVIEAGLAFFRYVEGA